MTRQDKPIDAEGLLPCPFCQAEVIFDHGNVGHYLDPTDCPLAYNAFDLAEWNARAPDPRIIDLEQQLEAMREVQPLETAPKDGSYFLIVGANFDGGAAVVMWDDDYGNWLLDDGKNFEIPLRHESKLVGWMPLPDAVARALLTKENDRG